MATNASNKASKVSPATLAKGFMEAGKVLHKVAPMVRAYIGNLTGDKLKAAKTAAYDAIRELAGRNEKGQLMAADKLPAEIRAAYDAARTAISRAIRKRDAKERGPIARLSAAQKAYNVAHEGVEAMLKIENCPPELIAAFNAAIATAVRLGAVAKETK